LTAAGEIKSMRTPSASRRRGAGRAILAHIIEVARSRGYARLNLETGSQAPFHAAHSLYESAGFVRTGPFGDYTGDTNSVFMTLRLAYCVRPVQREDYSQWRPLWDGYNAFYGRSAETALAEPITAATWERFFDASEPVHAFVATDGEQIVGIVHYLFHRSTTRLHDVCYLQDLFTVSAVRGRGIGRQLIEAVYAAAQTAGSSRVYWTTHTSNAAGRALYDKMAKHLGFIVYGHELAA
jgi:GNAT superfamily N-acetyltransferase